MSFENKNLYHLLGNDVEDEEPSLPPRELVKKNTSSKKKDEAPAKADPARAKNKKPVTGNEGAIKNKLNNKSVSAPSSTPSGHYKRPLDRHSRSQKGGQRKPRNDPKDGEAALEDEIDGEDDAVAEEDGEDVTVDQTPKKSLQEYLAELQLAQSSLDSNKNVRQANQGAESKWNASEKLVKQQEEYVPASVEKKVRAKAQKEKKFLDIQASFEDETPARDSAPRGRGSSRARGSRGSRGGARGGKPSTRGAKGPKDGKVALNDDKKFPSLS